jgi:hypothetical protein
MAKQSWDLGMAIKQNNRQLGYAVEEVVDGLVRSGEMARVYEVLGLQYELPGFYRDTAN